MKRFMTKENIFLCILFIVLTVGSAIGFTHSVPDTVERQTGQGSRHTYELTVSYDGITRYGRNSLTSNERMYLYATELIHVEDTLPPGLSFSGFVEDIPGQYITAQPRQNRTGTCSGMVKESNIVGDSYYKGLRYDESTRKISFDIISLEAGCEIKIRYNVFIPNLNYNLDYYNYFKVKYRDVEYYSNFTRLYIGDNPRYNVNYVYEGEVPRNAPTLPGIQSFAVGEPIVVLEEPYVKGYDFYGWTSSQLVDNELGYNFMPNQNVTYTGHFEKKSTNKVTYVIEGDKPKNYIEPKEREHYEGETIYLESISDVEYTDHTIQDEWTSDDVEFFYDDYSGGKTFVMPNKDVVIKGSFKKRTYNIILGYNGDLTQSFRDSLPKKLTFDCGSEATYPILPEDPTGRNVFYRWVESNEYITGDGIRPINGSFVDGNYCHDYKVIGYWLPKSQVTDIEVFKTVDKPKSGYNAGDKVQYKIKVENGKVAADDIFLEESLENVTILPGNGYRFEEPNLIVIPHMEANSFITINAEMTMPNNNENTITNTVRRIGATIPEQYALSDKNKESSATITRGASLTVCNNVDHPLNEKVFQFEIRRTTNTGESYETWLNLKNAECKTVDIGTGGFIIKEIIPQEYSLTNITGADDYMQGRNFGYVHLSSGDNRTITFYNTLSETGFLHGYGSVENTIPSSEMPELLPAKTSSIVFVSSYETVPGTQYMPELKFQNTERKTNIVEYDVNHIIEGTYIEPNNCSYFECKIPKNNTSVPPVAYISAEFRFLGWSTEPQDEVHLRGYNFNEAEGKILFSNGIPTNLDIEEGDVVYLYAIYEYYHPDGLDCTISDINFHTLEPNDNYPFYEFKLDDFTNFDFLSPDKYVNTVRYGYCNNDPDQTYQLVDGEYHAPLKREAPNQSEPLKYWNFESEGNTLIQLGEDYARYTDYYPINSSNPKYSEMQRFGVSVFNPNSPYDLIGDIIRFGITYNSTSGSDYILIDVYADSDHRCPGIC